MTSKQVIHQAKAFTECLKAARIARRPFRVKQGDVLRAEQLPHVSEDYAEPPLMEISVTFGTIPVIDGWRYGVIKEEFKPGVGIERTIGVWNG